MVSYILQCPPQEREEGKASRVHVEYDEIYQALTNINDQIVDWEEQQQDKEEGEEEPAEEKRKRETEKLSQTKRPKSTDDTEKSTPKSGKLQKRN